jgi:hypothetical protein
MSRHRKHTPLILLGITILAILLLSSGLSELQFQSGRSLNILDKLGELRSDEPISGKPGEGDFPIEAVVLIFFWTSLVFALIFAIVSPRYRKLLLRTFITMLFLLFAFSLMRPSQPDTIIEDEEEPAQMDEAVLGQNAGDSPETPDFVSDPPHWFMMVVNVVVALLLAAAFWLLWRFMRARDDDTQTLLVQQAEIALSDLTAGGDLKDVIMRCYASMSQVLYQSRNIQRDEAMTPREFEIHLAEIGLQDRHIQRLTRLFESVRYGASSPGELAQREALDCLRAIARAWGAS